MSEEKSDFIKEAEVIRAITEETLAAVRLWSSKWDDLMERERREKEERTVEKKESWRRTFAMAAMEGMLSSDKVHSRDSMIRESVLMADMLLNELERTKK